jgi:DNA modification methylase
MSKRPINEDVQEQEENEEILEQEDLGISTSVPSGPVECLGKTFPSDEARRDHFLKELAAKLKDPSFRKIEGFPIGEDADILALSDPPFYTACPNPWLADFIEYYGHPYTPKEKYHREPFAADVTEGKNHPIYNAHSYHTKVPHRAIMRYILHYTDPGDVLFDGFAGTGMAGVAAQLCGDRAEVQALGYRVRDDGIILNDEGKPFSILGARRAILNDLSPAATFISYNYNTPVDVNAFEREAKCILKEVDDELGWMYETKHTDGSKRRIDYTVWSEVFTCPECGGEVTFLDETLDEESGKTRDAFPCPHCNANLTKRKVERLFETVLDPLLAKPWKRVKFKPCLIQYRVGNIKYEKAPDKDDFAVLTRIEKMPLPLSMPANRWPIEQMYHGSRIAPKGFTHTHQFFLPRAAQTMSALWQKASAHTDLRLRSMLLFFVEQAIWTISRLNRYRPTGFSQVNQYLTGVYYLAAQHAECSPWYILGGKAKRLVSTFGTINTKRSFTQGTTASADISLLPANSLSYIFTDPPFGENIYYADMNILVESWHRVFTNTKSEAIIDGFKGKGLPEYQRLMLACFREYFRVLKPGRWMTVEFSNSQATVWNTIQTTLQEAGFVVANVAALDKQQRSFRSVTSPTAVKQDLIISAYKPNGGLEGRFAKTAETETGVWDFIKTHLGNLPVVKAKGGQLEHIAERDPRILFDRTVAFYVCHSIPVPISSAEFQSGLAEKFPERDGMFFLPDQAAEYDKVRMKMEGLGQLSIWVEDERSAVDWLRNYLKKTPSKYQDIQPEFFEQLTLGWKKWETKPELRALLDQYFLCYQGEGDIPPQIHSYLSTNYKDLRNMPADHALLRNKARDCWFVPDPRKNADVEQLREKRLLEEFWSYLPPGYEAAARTRKPNEPLFPGMNQLPTKQPKGKRITIVRTEAVRVGFNFCFARNDYTTIIAVAQHIPDDVIQNDEQLQMIYDSAVTRTEAIE